jgi:hypothetical protein
MHCQGNSLIAEVFVAKRETSNPCQEWNSALLIVSQSLLLFSLLEALEVTENCS